VFAPYSKHFFIDNKLSTSCISLGEKYEINKIKDKESYTAENIERLKIFGDEVKRIAKKNNI